jgi:hypothetical protein
MTSYRNSRYEMPFDKEGHLDPSKAYSEHLRKKKVSSLKKTKSRPKVKKEGYTELYA